MKIRLHVLLPTIYLIITAAVFMAIILQLPIIADDSFGISATSRIFMYGMFAPGVGLSMALISVYEKFFGSFPSDEPVDSVLVLFTIGFNIFFWMVAGHLVELAFTKLRRKK